MGLIAVFPRVMLVTTLKELAAWVKNDPALSFILSEAQKEQSGDAAHDLSHLMRVALWTLKLGGEKIIPREAVAAAFLHDLVNVPKNHPDRSKASEFSAAKARPILASLGFDSQSVERIAGAIRDHSFSRGSTPDSDLGKALQDADRLEALGAIGIMRVFSTGNRMGTKYFHPEDPWSQSRPLDDMKFSVDHFFTKLLKLPPTFHTEKGREEAARRAQTLEDFLQRTAEELGVPRV